MFTSKKQSAAAAEVWLAGWLAGWLEVGQYFYLGTNERGRLPVVRMGDSNSKYFQAVVVADRDPVRLGGSPLYLVDLTLGGVG